MFQSHDGSIQTYDYDLSLIQDLSFNPTMVRFKQVKMDTNAYGIKRFQSHDGSIQTYCCASYKSRFYWFQSHDGSIQTELAADLQPF